MPDEERTPEETRRHLGTPDFLTTTGDDVEEETGAQPQETARETRRTTPDSGAFGVGSNAGQSDDNAARETTPGYQADKADRGTIMPRG